MDRLPILVRWVIWGALTLSIAVYLVVLQTMEGSAKPDPDAAGLKSVFYIVGGLSLLLSQGLRYLVNHLSTPEGAPRIPAWIDQAFIASLAFAELPAILGLVLGLSGALFPVVLPLFVIAALGMAMNNPTAFYRADLRQADGRTDS